MSKKIIIIGIVIVLLASAGILYYFNVFGIRNAVEIPDFGSAFPDSDTSGTLTENEPTEDTLPASTDTVFDRLTQITTRVVAGYTTFEHAGDTVIRYAERGTGHIYEYNINTGLDQKISNKTIPGLINAIWGKGGNVFISQELVNDKLKTTHYSFEDGGVYVFETKLALGDRGVGVLELQKFLNRDPDTRIVLSGVGSLGNETTYFGEKTKAGVVLFQEKYKDDILELSDTAIESGVLDKPTRSQINSLRQPDVGQGLATTQRDFTSTVVEIVISPSGENMFYLAEDADSEGVVGILSTIDLKNSRQIFSSPISQWVVSWDNDEEIIISSTPSADILGVTYTLDAVSGELTKITDEGLGQIVRLSPDGTHVVKTMSTSDSFESFVANIQSDSVREITKTLPQKCTWSNIGSTLYCAVPQVVLDGKYPDTWFRGEVSFSDSFWVFGVDSPTQSIVYNPATNTGIVVDAYNLMLTKSEKHLLYINKRSLELWALGLQ